MEQTAKHIIFTGNVQGIGFRYTANRIANQHRLCGFVRNLPDGAVEMLAQGIPGDINGCIEDIKADFAGCVRQTIIVEMPLDTRYKDFRITF